MNGSGSTSASLISERAQAVTADRAQTAQHHSDRRLQSSEQTADQQGKQRAGRCGGGDGPWLG
jgi:hypothetical protein